LWATAPVKITLRSTTILVTPRVPTIQPQRVSDITEGTLRDRREANRHGGDGKRFPLEIPAAGTRHFNVSTARFCNGIRRSASRAGAADTFFTQTVDSSFTMTTVSRLSDRQPVLVLYDSRPHVDGVSSVFDPL
jgi:hypothetical protein